MPLLHNKLLVNLYWAVTANKAVPFEDSTDWMPSAGEWSESFRGFLLEIC